MKTIAVLTTLALAGAAWCQTTVPTTRPATTITPPNPDLMLKQLLSPSRPQRPLEPVDLPVEKDQSSRTAVAPKADTLNLVREGTYIVDRVGRLTISIEGQKELTFEADGAAMKDPPMLLLPNTNRTRMEMAVQASSRDLKFRVTGMVTEYNARNYILLEKVVVVQDGGPGLLPRKGEDKDPRK